MHRFRKNAFALVFGSLALFLWGCDEEGPAERAGEQVDNAIQEAGEALESAGEKVEEKTE